MNRFKVNNRPAETITRSLPIETAKHLYGMASIPWLEGEYHRDLDTMDRWSVAEIGKHWLSVTDLSTDFTRSASIEVHRIGHRIGHRVQR